MPQSVLIIGEDPALIDFSAPGVPPDMDADKVMRGLNRWLPAGSVAIRADRSGLDSHSGSPLVGTKKPRPK